MRLLMATYKVTTAQNIWDIAIQLYGTIEGAFDLFISNPTLTMATDLEPGMELEYHEDFVINQGIVDTLASNNEVPANSERHVYYKETQQSLRLICVVPEDDELVKFSVCGNGTMVVDWGDNTELQDIELTVSLEIIEHYFDNTVDQRRIKIYGEFEIETLDATYFTGTIYPVKSITVDEFISHANSGILTGLFLFKGTKTVDLQYSTIYTLDPIAEMSLQELNLLNVRFDNEDVLDDYLEYLVENHGTRRGCTVYLSTQPSSRGMAAINTLISDDTWNDPHPWKFVINDEVYTYNN